MIPEQIEHLIIKFLNQSANINDLQLLDQWIKESENQKIFKTYVKTQYSITLSTNTPNPEEIREFLLHEIRKEKSPFYSKRFKSMFKYAATILLLAGTGFFFKDSFFNNQQEEIIVPKLEAITLTLENGNTQVISEDGTSTIVDSEGNIVGNQQKRQLIYKVTTPINQLVYNTIKVPYGKRFNLVLSDGTEVFINSGTTLKYPVKFLKGYKREVFLNGEAYFDVAKDASHPFIVDVDELDVEVLGTKFNVTTYPEDHKTEVILVEGSVELETAKTKSNSVQSMILEPGYKASYHKEDDTFSTKKVNTSIYTSWINGEVIFRNTTFDDIVKKLERLYNVTIINNNQKLGQEVFNAGIEVDNESINDVLRYFNKVYTIDYTITSNTIIIN